MKFTEHYNRFIELCHDKIPPCQVQELQELLERQEINPTITPEPRDWLIDSFEWYVGLKMIRGETYGPFYRIDGDYFWPTIGNMYDPYSETQCFFGFERPRDPDDVKLLYKIQEKTKNDFVYEINIAMPEWPIIDNAYLFMGAVKDAEGFQINPNRRVVELLREQISNDQIKRFPIGGNEKYNYGKEEIYVSKKPPEV